jgi:glycosyltransferase involved in cell wall biosynthesis
MTENLGLKVLVELRPALDGHAGIPQETRLLFGALSTQETIELEGLLQTSFTFLPAGIDEVTQSLPQHEKINRFSNVVISLSESVAKKNTITEVKKYFERRVVSTTKFLPLGFEDFIWRRMFEKTLSAEYFDAVTKKRMCISGVPWGVMQMIGIWSFKLFGKASFPNFNLEQFDVFIAQTPYPARLSGNTKLIVRYHDAVPMFLPHTIGHQKKHQANHYQALVCNVQNGAYFACVSDATRNDLLRIFPELEDRAVTIHNMVSHHYFEEAAQSDHAMTVIRSRVSVDKDLSPAFTALDDKEKFYKQQLLNKSTRYLLMVSTLEPRKNHHALINAWQHIRAHYDSDLKLVMVGGKGWGSESLIQRIRPLLDQGQLFLLNAVPADELRVLYRNAEATVCPSFAEGFDYSGVEAMRCSGRVLASDIPVHREIYSEGALYFNPYDSSDLINLLHRTLYSNEKTDISINLRMNALKQSKRYLRETILPKWHDLLTSVVNASGAA